MTSLPTIADRIAFAMQKTQISQVTLARRCGVAPSSVHGWLSGKSRFVRGENLLIAAKVLAVSPLWLALGKGQMQPGKDDLKMFDDFWVIELQFDSTLLATYRSLTATQRNLCQLSFKEQVERFIKN